MTERNYYVYRHTSPSSKVYIGITNNPQRRWGRNGEGYLTKARGHYVQCAFARAILKYGWDNFKHEILFSNITLKEAQELEIKLIAHYKSLHISYNMTNGGEGTCGIHPKISPERRKKISEFMRKHHPMKGKHHTEEARKKIGEASRGRVCSDETRKKKSLAAKNRRHTEESKKKMSIYRKQHPETWVGGWNKQPVYQYDLQGKFLRGYSSIEEACENVIHKHVVGDISNCCKGIISSACGYIWRFEKVPFIDVSKYKIVKTAHGARLYDITKEGKQKRRDAHGTAVNQYTLDGRYIATFNSLTDAAEQTHSNHRGITGCCKHQKRYKTAGGYRWEYDTGENRVAI